MASYSTYSQEPNVSFGESNAANSDVERDVLEPIAIIGFSFKYPQDADSPASLWRMMEDKRCAMTEWPKDRIYLDAFYHRDDKVSSWSCTSHFVLTYNLISVNAFVPGAHFLKEELDAFDAPFFGISATEAMAMDPQHRIPLETAYRALENGVRHSYGKCVWFQDRCYSGSMADDYKLLLTKDLDDLPKYTATGVSANMIANRLGWFYNFTGPSANSIHENDSMLCVSGTGTALGDSIEADAVGGMFKPFHAPEDPLYIGALKANIGHLGGGSGSGVAGLIKTVMVLEKGIIPPNANFEHLNPGIDAEFSNLKFPTEATPWPTEGLRRASVNSFGFGGLNAHVGLDDAFHYSSSRGLAAAHCTVEKPPFLDPRQANGNIETSMSWLLPRPSLESRKVAACEAMVNGVQAKDTANGCHKPKTLGPSLKVLIWSTADENGIDRLMRKLSRALSVAAESIDTGKPLHVYGVDSLLALELRNFFTKVFKADVAVFDIMGVGKH